MSETLYPSAAPVPVSFHGATLFVIEHANRPYTPLRPIVEGMGLDWAGQFTKVKKNRQRWGVEEIAIPTQGGQQIALCLPLRKVLGWLMTVQPAKVKPALRPKIEAYQAECDDVLWEHWVRRSGRQTFERRAPETNLDQALRALDRAAECIEDLGALFGAIWQLPDAERTSRLVARVGGKLAEEWQDYHACERHVLRKNLASLTLRTRSAA